MMTRTQVLEGIRVIEIGHMIAGPTAAMILGDLGADVIKIEPPGVGESFRRSPHGNASVYFLNRNKRSLALNLNSEEGREIGHKLIKRSDVLIENYAPDSMAKLGFGYDQVKGINPRLVYCSIKGFLPGPYEHRRSLDEIAQMMGGLAYMTGLPRQPFRAGTSVSDSMAGTFAAVAILAALVQRHITGTGQYVTSGLFESVVFLVGQYMARHQMSGEPVQPLSVFPMGPRYLWAVYDVFDTSDGRQVFVGTPAQQDWERFCRVFDLEHLLQETSLQTPKDRVQAREWLIPMLKDHIVKFSSAELMEKLEKIGTPFGPVQSPADLKDDPHLKAGKHLLAVHAAGHTLQLPCIPIRTGTTTIDVRIQPPEIGEHNDDVLKELGYSERSIVDFHNKGVIGSPRKAS